MSWLTTYPTFLSSDSRVTPSFLNVFCHLWVQSKISSFSQVSCEDDSRKIDLKKLKNKGIPFKISNCYLNKGPGLPGP